MLGCWSTHSPSPPLQCCAAMSMCCLFFFCCLGLCGSNACGHEYLSFECMCLSCTAATCSTAVYAACHGHRLELHSGMLKGRQSGLSTPCIRDHSGVYSRTATGGRQVELPELKMHDVCCRAVCQIGNPIVMLGGACYMALASHLSLESMYPRQEKDLKGKRKRKS